MRTPTVAHPEANARRSRLRCYGSRQTKQVAGIGGPLRAEEAGNCLPVQVVASTTLVDVPTLSLGTGSGSELGASKYVPKSESPDESWVGPAAAARSRGDASGPEARYAFVRSRVHVVISRAAVVVSHGWSVAVPTLMIVVPAGEAVVGLGIRDRFRPQIPPRLRWSTWQCWGGTSQAKLPTRRGDRSLRRWGRSRTGYDARDRSSTTKGGQVRAREAGTRARFDGSDRTRRGFADGRRTSTTRRQPTTGTHPEQ